MRNAAGRRRVARFATESFIVTHSIAENVVLSYSEAFKDHLSKPHGAGELANADIVTEQTNPVCGDRLQLSLKLRGDVIEEARFLAYGCAPTLACGSALVKIVQGMTVHQAALLTRQELVRELGGLPARKSHAAALTIETLRVALESLHLDG